MHKNKYTILQLVVVVHKVISVFHLMVDVVKDEWKSVTTMNGEQCVGIILVLRMPV